MVDLIGPVTRRLEEELLTELRRRGIVIWLDRDGHYSDYVDSLVSRHSRGEFPHPVVAFRGSFLEAMLALEPLANGLDPTPLLLHMPGFTEETMRGTPLLEVYRAGFRFRRALDTLIRDAAASLVPPDEVSAFLAGGAVTLADADAWLERHAGTDREGLAGLLDRVGVEVVVRELLVKDTFLGDQVHADRGEDVAALRVFFSRQLGMDEPWVDFVGAGERRGKPLALLREAVASWVLCVEYVDDLIGPPHLQELRPLGSLPKQVVSRCRDLASALRAQHPDEYEPVADQVEAHLEGELPRIRPEALGRVDTFRGEEARILEAAVAALGQGDWAKARDWAEVRTAAPSFWLARDQRRRVAWGLVGDAATLGCLLVEHPRPLAGVGSFGDALGRYAGTAFRVDQAHRRFEQRRSNQLATQLPHFARLKELGADLRRLYRGWADQLAVDFSDLCRARGPLPDASLQQRTLFEQVVMPLSRGDERVAVVLVDGLRYEMAAELEEALAEHGDTVSLSARLAELPTITAVGMNALAPAAQGGRLTLAGSSGFKGFKCGEFTVDGPEDRARAMGLRSGSERALSLSLAEVCDMGQAALTRKVAQKRLVVVHDRELDDAGEAGVGLATFERTLRQVKAGWLHLKGAGVGRLVVASDHGFLLQDETTAVRPYGKKTDPSHRYVLADERRVEAGLVTVSLSELGYVGREGFLLLPEDTGVFATRDPARQFVHGGNSPQERVIPVLTVASAGKPGKSLSAYVVEAVPAEDALGRHRLRVRLVYDRASAALPLAPSAPVDLAIGVPDRTDIQAVVVDVTGPSKERGGRVQAPVGEEWSEVFFALHGPRDEQVRVLVNHPDAVEQVTPCVVEGWFSVDGTAEKEVAPAATPLPAEAWSAALPDDGTRALFVHLDRHGSITESEAVAMLGSPRRLRQVSVRFEELCALTPLKVRIEVTPEGKRYVKEGREE